MRMVCQKRRFMGQKRAAKQLPFLWGESYKVNLFQQYHFLSLDIVTSPNLVEVHSAGYIGCLPLD